MAVLIDKGNKKYIEWQLFPLEESDGITYKLSGGEIDHQTKCEWFRLDNEFLYLFDSEDIEREVEEVIGHLREIRSLHQYRFQPIDEGEFLLKAAYAENEVKIELILLVLEESDFMDENKLPYSAFQMSTSVLLLEKFLDELEWEKCELG